RQFISEIGRDAAALFLPVALPSTMSGQVCAPPGNTSNPSAWARDCRSIQHRRPASTLTSSEITKLKAAYKAMRDLATSDPTDPRGFTHQANIHCHNCGGGGSVIQVHSTFNSVSLRFLPWHRAYLYFHERILGHLIGDTNFRLPYWDWENPNHREIPSAYNTPNNATNSLFNATRSMGPNDVLDPTDGQPGTALGQVDFNNFSPSLEGSPHGSVHVEVGGDMGAFDTAGNDPIFYAHHANVDKLWSDWMKADPTHTAPATAVWQNQTQGFFNENKVWMTIRNVDVVNHESNLRYIYSGRTWEFISWRCILNWRIFEVAVNIPRIRFLPPVRKELAAVPERAAVHMRVVAPQLPVEKSASYFVYFDERDAKANRGPASPGYVGMIPIVRMDREGRHKTTSPPFAEFEISPRLKGMLERKEDLDLYFVDRDQKGGNVVVSKLPFRRVQIRVAREG
ncbi:MAG: tyrosinase family protein, partial [Bryobacteraceae bacterium]